MGLYEDAQEEIKEALKELERMEGDPALREEYEALEYDIREKGSRLRDSFERGEKKKEKEIVLNMYKKKMSLDDICEITNLSKEEVKKIINEQQN